MNSRELVGLLWLPGGPGAPPVQPAGQIADVGGGALMAAFGILAALRERERSGEGQFVDVSMSDGALSWLALVAGRHPCDRVVPRRGTLELVRAREMVVELDQPGTDGVRQLGVPVKMSRTPGSARSPGPALGEHTDEVLAAAGYSEAEIAELEEAGAVGGPAAGVQGSFMG